MIISNEYPKESFIGGYKIDKKICDDIIDYFKKNNHLHIKGKVGGGFLEPDKKDSLDLGIDVNRFDHPFLNYRIALKQCLDAYVQTYTFVDDYSKMNCGEMINIQYYKPNAGYRAWHFENVMNEKTKDRVLVFMTYLNDVPDGGTEFYYQGIKTKAEKGLTLIWPAHFTHTHRGIISQTNEKYIITGWIDRVYE